ncbi:alpha-internexin [Rhinatrema bivittatum]|uniref:alpha-internexin n=1 Tax=Rhinatrema bivittatum TaxID=194408 RepID=UPI00112EE104|nr:alpha-internexin [Rhinatrema bivittatum]
MSFSAEHYLSSSYRKIFGDAPRSSAARLGSGGSSSRTGAVSSGFRPQSLSRSNVSSASTSSSSLGSYRRQGRAGGGGAAFFAAAAGESLDLSQTSALNNEFKIIRTNEKEQLQGLNDRFAVFIEKVHQLEQQNKVLEAELLALRQRHAEPSRLGELYQQELRELRAQLEELSAEKAQVGLERDGLEEELRRAQGRAEEEGRAREELERALRAHKKDVDAAALARLELERKVESLLDEIAFLRRVHEEEVAELLGALRAAQVSVELEVAKPDLTSALRDIRAQYESLAAKNLQSADEWYKSKYVNLSEQAARSTEAVRASREEMSEYRRQLQCRTIEIESLRGTNESLERQLQEMEERHGAEAAGLQDTINQLEIDLQSTKSEMARHLREYQDLLNVKMALDIEIAAYRKLLEGEETRFSTGGIGMSTVNPNPSYSFQSKAFTSSASKMSPTPLLHKKGEKEESLKMVSKTSTQIGETFEEIIEESIVSTKKVDKPEHTAVNSEISKFTP